MFLPKFGRWTVNGLGKKKKWANGKYEWLIPCRCDCGTVRDVLLSSLRRGSSKSCGCWQGELVAKAHTTHGQTGTRLYKIWEGMKGRCYIPTTSSYSLYGGRGITMCDEWRNSFESFARWAHANGYKDNLSIDRIDKNGNYEPDNCRWATPRQQSNNIRSNRMLEGFGEVKTVAQWARDQRCTVSYKTLQNRIYAGWKPERAISTPLQIQYSRKRSRRAFSGQIEGPR